ncbi:MAG: UMP kinase [Lachnospiraceae bacterium]|nr:UMP kinase [Lachnospiraceae bacterium]MCR4938254.1 UMP kinase [Lachnospiraceae bacterium]
MSRILLKLSGEALSKDGKYDDGVIKGIAAQVKNLTENGTEIGIVIGGGNYWRGRSSENIDRTKADQIGMLATVMNCIYVSEIFRLSGIDTEIFTPFACSSFTNLFSKDEALKAMKAGKAVFFAGGTGHPFFSTDTGVVLRAAETGADAIYLAKAVDGVYDSDPKTNPDAVKYDEISIDDVISGNLQVVDMTASILARDRKIPMFVFDLTEKDSIIKAVSGDFSGTKITV